MVCVLHSTILRRAVDDDKVKSWCIYMFLWLRGTLMDPTRRGAAQCAPLRQVPIH
jgi:hypothetical protein